MPDENLSPVQLALRRFQAKAWPRWGLRFVLAVLALGIYAPFLCSETAWLWIDEDGWRLPLLADLFNYWTFPNRHDLLFNLTALLLPFLLLGGWLLRRRISFGRRLLGGAALIVLAWVGCMLPLIPDGKGNMRAIWRRYPASLATVQDFKDREQANKDALADDPTATPAPLPRACFAPIPHRFDATYPGAVLKAPGTVNSATGARFWLGTDSAGHDVLSRMLFGARISMTVGLVATGLSLLIGVLIGGISGYFGGLVDIILQRVVELMMCFPTFILILVVVAMLDRSIFVIMTVIGLTGWAGTARLVRGEFLGQSVREYVLAAQAQGLPKWRIMFRHILPNCMTPLTISATFGIAGAVMAESGLSFLGLGDPNAASWGGLLEQGRNNIRYGWLIWCPGMAVFLIIASLNQVGNGLREAFDPKQGT